MENEQEIRRIAQQVFDQTSSDNQFSISNIGLHTHNAIDSARVSFNNISNKYMVIPYTLFGTQGATAGNYSVFFTCPFNLKLISVTEVHTVLGTDGSAVTLQIEKLTGTTAAGSGTSLLVTAFNLKATINTVQTGSLITTVGTTQFASGDRIALKLSGTPTAVANVTVTLLVNY